MCQSEPKITHSCIRVLVVSSVRVRFLHKTLMTPANPVCSASSALPDLMARGLYLKESGLTDEDRHRSMILHCKKKWHLLCNSWKGILYFYFLFLFVPVRQIWSNQISIRKSWLKVDGLLLFCGFTSLWASDSESLGGEGELKSAEDFLLSLEKEKWEYWCGAQSCPSGCFSWQMSCNEWEVTGQSFVRDV